MKKERSPKALLIEDDLSHAQLIMREFGKAGFGPKGVKHATSGKQGLEILKTEDFDLVLLDYSPPMMDGLNVLKRLKETGSKTPVVVITGQGNEGMAAIATKLRTHGYIPNSDLFSPKQAANLLGVTYQTIKNYIYRGTLKTCRTPGGHHRIRREDIIKLGFLKDADGNGFAENYGELYHNYIDTLGALTDALDARDGTTSGHSRRVAGRVVSLAKVMGITGREREEIKLAALLHDIGKIFINEQILSKPGKLTDQEYYLIRQHPEIGERILDGVEILKGIKPLIRHHHERFDGRGYPDGLSGEDIPLGARMIALGETFDCVTSDCTFQNRRGIREAVDVIKENSSTQFDPEVVRIFLGSLDEVGPMPSS